MAPASSMNRSRNTAKEFSCRDNPTANEESSSAAVDKGEDEANSREGKATDEVGGAAVAVYIVRWNRFEFGGLGAAATWRLEEGRGRSGDADAEAAKNDLIMTL